MKKALFFFLALLFPSLAFGDLNASFSGASLNFPGSDYSNIFEYKLENNGFDSSGENLLATPTAFGSWTGVALTSVSSDVIKSPIPGVANADGFIGTAVDTQHGVSQAVTLTAVKHKLTAVVRPGNKSWFYLADSTASAYAYFRIDSSQAVGTTSGLVSSEVRRIDTNWVRIAIEFTGTAAAHTIQLYSAHADTDNDFTGDAVTINSYVAVANLESIGSNGLYTNAILPVNKPRLDIASAGGSITSVLSYLQSSDGNRLGANYFSGAASTYYTRTNHAALGFLDDNFTVTAIVKYTASTSDPAIFSKGAYDAGGVACQMVGGTQLYCYFSKSGADVYVYKALTADSIYHVVQLVRDTNLAKLCIDGSCSATTDVTGYGIDNATAFTVGSWGTFNRMIGDILYLRGNSRALSTDELAKDREFAIGIVSGDKNKPTFTFTRSTTAMQAYGTGGIRSQGINIPRVGSGVLVEAQGSNICLQSEVLGTTWTSVNLTSITANGRAAPDGMITEDGLVADADDEIHGITQDIAVTAVPHTFSIYGAAGNKGWAFLSDNTLANATSYYNLTTCTVGAVGASATAKATWEGPDCRISLTFTGTAATHTFSAQSALADGDADFAGDAVTVNSWFWGSQLETGSFATSYIPTTTGSVTRTADSLTMPSQSGNKIAVPASMSNTTPSKKYTVEFKVQCGFASATDVGATKQIFEISGATGTASGTRNRLQIYAGADGKLNAWMMDNADADHYGYSSALTSWNQWHRYKFFVDFSDLSRMALTVDGSAGGVTYSGNTGTATWDTTGTSVRFGQDNAGTVSGACAVKDLRAIPVEF